jgi:hypothetical protein
MSISLAYLGLTFGDTRGPAQKRRKSFIAFAQAARQVVKLSQPADVISQKSADRESLCARTQPVPEFGPGVRPAAQRTHNNGNTRAKAIGLDNHHSERLILLEAGTDE